MPGKKAKKPTKQLKNAKKLQAAKPLKYPPVPC